MIDNEYMDNAIEFARNLRRMGEAGVPADWAEVRETMHTAERWDAGTIDLAIDVCKDKEDSVRAYYDSPTGEAAVVTALSHLDDRPDWEPPADVNPEIGRFVQ